MISQLDILIISQDIFSHIHISYLNDILRYPLDILPISPSGSGDPAKAAGVVQTMCARPDNTAGSRPAHVCPYGITFGRSALTGAVAGSSLCGRPATAAGKLPWARGLAVLFTTRMTAWMPSLGLRGLFLAELHHSQNQ